MTSFTKAVRGDYMDIPHKIKMAVAYAGISEAELARRIGCSPQSLHQRLKTGKFSSADLERIAKGLGAELVFCFKFPNGDEV